MTDSGQRISDVSTSSSYKKGDFCRVMYEGIGYEIEVLSVSNDKNGVPYCTVEFLGYGHEDTVWSSELRPSEGEFARNVQVEESSREANDGDAYHVGEYCRVVNYVDCNEYEGKIKSVGATEDGMKYYTVKFLGYNDVDNVWLSELKPSLGKEARALARNLSVDPTLNSSCESDGP